MGRFHAKVLRDLGYEVVTVDPNPVAGADYATTRDIPGGLTRFDAAAVATPPGALVPTAYHLAGIRKVLVEKPYAYSSEVAVLITKHMRDAGSDVCVGLTERFNPQARALKRRAVTGARTVKFTRWNDRPSFDVDLDLKLHDVDLALWLGVNSVAEFDTRADSRERVRAIEVTKFDGTTQRVDLMAHDLSPLHALWHAFLTDGEYPTPEDVIHAHRFLDLLRDKEEVAA